MKLSQTVNEWRVVPRLLVGWYAILVWQITDWYMLIPEPTTQQTSFVTTIVGLSTAIFGLYVNSGKKDE